MESSHITDIHAAPTQFTEGSRRSRLSSLISQIRAEFDEHFDRSWLEAIYEELPLENRNIREIRDFLSVADLTINNEQAMTAGIDELRKYIAALRKHLLPNIKELLGVSEFSSARVGMDKSQYVLRRLTAHAFPYNLANLEVLVDALELTAKSA